MWVLWGKFLGNSCFFYYLCSLESNRNDMKGKHSIFLLLILVALMSCNDPKPITETLHRSEVLMNEDPDSAWTLLNTIYPDEMEQNRNRALYALLYTQAQDKTYRDETNDSLISVAVDYYRHTNDVRHKFLSYYYKGRVHFNVKDYLGATTCYMEAEQLADDVGDNYLVGLLYAEMGRLYEIYYDYPKSLEAYQKATECYERAGKIRHRNYMWYNQSSIYRNMNDYDRSEEMLRMALNSGKEEHDATLVKNCLGALVMQCVEQEQIQQAWEFYEELQSLIDGHYGSVSFHGTLAKMYVSRKDYNRAKQLIANGWERTRKHKDSIDLYLSEADLLYKSGEESQAYQKLLKGITLQNKDVRKVLQQPMLTAQRDYLSDKLAFEVYRLQMERHLRILYILFFSLLLLIVVHFLHRKIKKEKEKARQTIDGLNHKMLQKEKESQKLQHQQEEALQQKRVFVTDLFKQWCEVMGLWTCLYEDKNLKASDKLKSMGREVALLKDKYMVGSKAFRELERLVNTYHEDAMYHFRQEVSLPDETDYRRVCYYFAGFSIPTIAWLMNEKVENIYQRRLRIRKNVSVLESPHRDLFLLLLCK